jgi:hypothetical protein
MIIKFFFKIKIFILNRRIISTVIKVIYLNLLFFFYNMKNIINTTKKFKVLF